MKELCLGEDGTKRSLAVLTRNERGPIACFQPPRAGAGVFTAAEPVALPGPTISQLTVTGLTDGVTSGIKMRAVNEVGKGEYSDIVYLICASKPATPGAPA